MNSTVSVGNILKLLYFVLYILEFECEGYKIVLPSSRKFCWCVPIMRQHTNQFHYLKHANKNQSYQMSTSILFNQFLHPEHLQLEHLQSFPLQPQLQALVVEVSERNNNTLTLSRERRCDKKTVSVVLVKFPEKLTKFKYRNFWLILCRWKHGILRVWNFAMGFLGFREKNWTLKP